MNTFFRATKYIIILIILVTLARWGGVAENYLKNKVVESTHDTLIETKLEVDTITNTVETQKVLTKVIEKIIPAKIDTAKLIDEYFKKRIYINKYQDTNLDATVTDTILHNHLIGQSMKYTIYRPTITETKTITITKTPQIKTGIYFNSIYSEKNIKLGVNVTHKKYIFGAAMNPFNKSWQVNGGVLLYKK